MNILVPSIPARLKITQTLIEDAIYDPVGPCQYIFNEELDYFERVRLKICWHTPRVMDSSGFSSVKTRGMWRISVLRAIILWDHVSAVYYQNFPNGQLVYWKHFNEVAARAPIFRAQMGRQRIVGLDGATGEEAKAVGKGPSCWQCDFKNGSKVMMPAPGFFTDAKTQAGLRFNDLYIDEWTKIVATGTTGIDDQLIGRTTRHSFNQNHPLFCNHHLFLATAEDVSHPGYARFKSYEDEQKRGNPDYYVFSMSYKDYSDKPFDSQVTHKEKFRVDKVINDLRKGKSRAGFLQEAFGIWSRNGRGWYVNEMMNQGYKLGSQIILGRNEDPIQDTTKVFYFAGIDPARAADAKAADGSIMILRAELVNPSYPNELIGYKTSFCHGYLVRGADVGQWSGIIHRMHQRYGFSKMCMDPGGGGLWIQPELRKPKQIIRGVEQKVKPIGSIEDEASVMIDGDFILMMFRPKDAVIAKVWADMQMKQADNLNDTAHVEFQEGFRNGIGLPTPYRKRHRSEIDGWSEERMWSNKFIDQMVKQLLGINVLTNPDGTAVYTKQQARCFTSRGKKDFAMAGLMAWMAFLAWMRSHDEFTVPDDQQGGMCSAWQD